MRCLFSFTLSLLLGTASAAALAQPSYPTRPITLVVGYPAGGSVDLVARTVAPKLAERLGQPVVVDNVGGAGGTIGAAKVVNAAADGYTLLLGSGSEVSIARLTSPAVEYDGQRDLAPIGLIGASPMVLVGAPRLAQKNVDQLLTHLRANPGKYSYASSGVGTPLHLAGEMIKQAAGVFIVHIPYRGAGQMVTDTIAGNVDLSVLVLSSALPHIRSGKLQPYGVTSRTRADAAPDIAALAEDKRLASVDMGVWFGLLAPARTSADIQARLQRDLAAVLADADVVRRLSDAGVRVTPGSSADFRSFIERETRKYEAIVRTANIKE